MWTEKFGISRLLLALLIAVGWSVSQTEPAGAKCYTASKWRTKVDADSSTEPSVLSYLSLRRRRISRSKARHFMRRFERRLANINFARTSNLGMRDPALILAFKVSLLRQ